MLLFPNQKPVCNIHAILFSLLPNMYLLTEEQIADMNIDVLPATLGEACDAFEEDKYIQEVLGEHISKKYLEAKRKEWHEYCRQVSDWETEAYLYKY